MLEVPVDVKGPLRPKLPALVKVAPFKVRELKNPELKAVVSDVAAEVLVRTKLLAAVKV